MKADLRHWAKDHPNRLAIEVGKQRLRYEELEAQANQLAHVFKACGLGRGDHVAALLTNSPFPLIVAWAAWRSGLYFTPVNTTLSPVETAYIIRDCQARLVIVDGCFATHAKILRSDPGAVERWFSHGERIDGVDAIEDAMATQSSSPREDESPGGLMLYTSGTTGAPSGVWRPLPETAGLEAPPFAADLIELFEFDSQTRYLSTAPLYHAAPLRVALAISAGGGYIRALEKFDAETALRLLSEEGMTHSQWVPTMFQRLLDLPPEVRAGFKARQHRVALHAAAPCPQPVKRAMIDWWGPILTEYYSGTEGVGLTMIDSTGWLANPGSVGRARKGVLHVTDEAGHELPAGEVGHIFFSGVSPFKYFGNPGKTAQRTNLAGWQTFGDIGYCDKDGYLYLTDRMDDVIISGGVNVYPQEIEAAILELHEVADCAVIGVPDEDFGECPVAVISAGIDVSPDILLDRVRAHCRERLGRIKQPQRYVVWDAIPRTAAGKLVRRELKSRVIEGNPLRGGGSNSASAE
ncbi:AMP-dependent synthetase [Paraburkholderia sacchari]|uniref:AMP-binding protein n=1 Tax=Paraburkholderia sacchari TaxID=159450 RepID=UPI0039A570A8